MRKTFLLLALTVCTGMMAQTQRVKDFRLTSPIKVQKPYIVDSLDVNGKSYDPKSILSQKVNLHHVDDAPQITADSIVLAPSDTDDAATLYLAAFSFTNQRRSRVSVSVEGVANYEVYVDGAKAGGERTLLPSRHDVIVKVLPLGEKADTMRVNVKGDVTLLPYDTEGKRNLDLMDLMTGMRCNGARISPDGKYLIYNTYETNRSGQTSYRNVLREIATGRETELQGNYSWMPKSSLMYYTRRDVEGRVQLVSLDPVILCQQVIADDFPDGYFTMSPTEDFVIFSRTDTGRAKDRDVYEIIEPEDRMTGFRNRNYLELYDLLTGVGRTLMFGHHNMQLADIAPDGHSLLVMSYSRRLTARPTSLATLLHYNLETGAVDTLVTDDGFMNGATFSPDGTQVILTGVPEAFDGIGKNVREGQTPNMYDYQMYIMTLADKKIRPMTKYFNPSVQQTVWNQVDGNLYILAEDKDCHHVFCMNPNTGAVDMIDLPEEYVSGMTLAKTAPVMAFWGQSLSNTSRLYTLNLNDVKISATAKKQKKGKGPVLIHDFSQSILANVQLGETARWDFVTSRGDTLSNTYVLPPSFDPANRYPMVVYYYGGCSPTSRLLDSHYSPHLYAAMGYVVLVVNPSGATGFGQEFSARHVNTAGEGVAQDIIESAKTFCQLHEWVNDKKVGCIGASYGGFMTQYLQTLTDFFAAAISHAGISDHTSYWGEGYWGYSYSEVSMANSYPWSHRDLYVGHSPLYNADKIHTPLLFLHGTVDTNVPVGESIQMFTALKLLGRPTAFVAVEGQDHHITDFNKRQKWQATIFAWFARWLQDDDSWWNDLYGDNKTLQ